MTDLEKAIQKARCYDTKYSEDFRFNEVMKDPLRFDQDYPKRLYLLLKEKHYRDGYLDGLADGRKETTEKISALEKENEQQKEQISTLLSCESCPENKGGYICDKEYNDKCLSQKIEYIKELKEQIENLQKYIETLSENYENEIEEYKKVNEKMKRCANCKFEYAQVVCVSPNKCKDMDRWELAE